MFFSEERYKAKYETLKANLMHFLSKLPGDYAVRFRARIMTAIKCAYKFPQASADFMAG